MDTPLLLLAVVAGLLLLSGIATFNRLARLKNTVRESWSGIEVALQRRYDLIPNLVETVQAYAAHERQVLETLTRLREQASSTQGIAGQIELAREIVQGLQVVLARAENYPQLQASSGFIDLQRELANTEDRIAAARRFYNSNVREYNTTIESFPASLVAQGAGHTQQPFFEVDELRVRQAPPVQVQ